ncbi:MAG: methylenetetrahydrofolate--tRNA-(uracil(54)-C(5))-methyltransferase (FADH(2)-oxidizing) TrmFO [Clostridia bacterium]|nr:methylenetetrahydrofolate--tRNA-(uracil(54)-C(5))-methyltransferase (FADH(2)-oxidizing) TrmFO [Clostridia bacterium]
MEEIVVIGGGLAGCEATYQLAKRGFKVKLYEMKPRKFSPAHHSDTLAEIVCSNSLKSNSLSTASGLLKAELGLLDSIIIKTARENSVPAGDALAVNRDEFSRAVDKKIRALKNVEIVNQEVEDFPTERTIIATGPLTSDALSKKITAFLGEDNLHFYDASAPIIDGDSIDYLKTFNGARYDKGESDYINCPMSKEEYELFVEELIHAKRAELHDFEQSEIFEGCMPIEIMASRGKDSLRFGPLKPVGLKDENGKRPYAVVQLRKENVGGSLYNLVGFQTNLTFSEQKRVFSLIPALKNAEFVKFGVMHRNSFINAPKFLNKDFSVKGYETLYIAGQLSGVEGYVESTMSGLIAGISMAQKLNNLPFPDLSSRIMIGAITSYLVAPNVNFQPMNANFGIVAPLDEIIRDKAERKVAYSNRAIRELSRIGEEYGIITKTDC